MHCLPQQTDNRFTALWILTGITQVSRYEKKHSPIHTHLVHQSPPIRPIHSPQPEASSPPNPRDWQSLSTISLQALFGLPLGLALSTQHTSSPNNKHKTAADFLIGFVDISHVTLVVDPSGQLCPSYRSADSISARALPVRLVCTAGSSRPACSTAAAESSTLLPERCHAAPRGYHSVPELRSCTHDIAANIQWRRQLW